MTYQQEALLALRVVIASLLGALVGWQRQHVRQEAGIRTFAAVALGSCVFVLIAPGDTHTAGQIASGIGFLGAGVIIRGRGHVHGLTTAAALWATASIGAAVAFGRYLTGSLVAIVLVGLLATPTKKWETEAAPAIEGKARAASL
jgi:putative Mg2+ transporter-C (MgtC) family protein